MTRHDETVRLAHMLDAAREAIELTKGRSRTELDDSRVLTLAVARLLEIIGEAASRVDKGLRERHPDIPWAAAVAMRNRIVHGYESIDVDIVWTTVEQDLPELVRKLESALGSKG
jgi:uncharacterized protein with HEPN domain